MKLLLERDTRTLKSTTGKLYVNSQFECFILEDVDRGLKQAMPLAEIEKRKLHGDTCIPEGSYKLVINYSARFKRNTPLLLNVPGYSGIRIHPGNTDADTEGCLLPGITRTKDFVSTSRSAYDKLFEKLQKAITNGEDITIHIN